MKRLPETPFVRHSSDAACRVAEDVIAAFAEEIDLLWARVTSVEAERDVYRMLAQEGMHALYQEAVKLHRLRTAHYQLVSEYRAHRAQQRREQAAA